MGVVRQNPPVGGRGVQVKSEQHWPSVLELSWHCAPPDRQLDVVVVVVVDVDVVVVVVVVVVQELVTDEQVWEPHTELRTPHLTVQVALQSWFTQPVAQLF